MDAILIFFGAGLGGLCRYWLSSAVYVLLNRNFPYGTLFVNVTGSFFMGLFFFLLINRTTQLSAQLQSLFLIGVLGGYTTFSSFSIETLNLFDRGAWVSALLNIFLSVFLCLIATWIGAIIGRYIQAV
jgi:CrcB protein